MRSRELKLGNFIPRLSVRRAAGPQLRNWPALTALARTRSECAARPARSSRCESDAMKEYPEPCVGREAMGETSAGERTGQPLSRETSYCPGCRRVSDHGRQHVRVRKREHSDPAWSQTLACAGALCAGKSNGSFCGFPNTEVDTPL
jgi:hypothetical protein